MMWWRILVISLLVMIAGLLVWDRDRVLDVVAPATPHEAYTRSLEAAGLDDTALVREWKAAADRAVEQAESVTLPIEATLRHEPWQPRAYGYRVELKRGRVLRTALEVESTEPTRVFVDVFRIDDEGAEHIVSARAGTTSIEHEIRRDGTYVVRIQPELLRGGPLRLVHRTTASLAFPVAGQNASAIRSYFGDSRDGGRREHHGVDIFAPLDTPVLAAADGFVSFVGTNRLGGNVVWVWDPARRHSHYYAHLSRTAVSAAERVRAGDIVGYVGNTGNARGTPPHLHFGIYAWREGPIDPLPFVNGATGAHSFSLPSSGEKPLQSSTGSGGYRGKRGLL